MIIRFDNVLLFTHQMHSPLLLEDKGIIAHLANLYNPTRYQYYGLFPRFGRHLQKGKHGCQTTAAPPCKTSAGRLLVYPAGVVLLYVPHAGLVGLLVVAMVR